MTQDNPSKAFIEVNDCVRRIAEKRNLTRASEFSYSLSELETLESPLREVLLTHDWYCYSWYKGLDFGLGHVLAQEAIGFIGSTFGLQLLADDLRPMDANTVDPNDDRLTSRENELFAAMEDFIYIHFDQFEIYVRET